MPPRSHASIDGARCILEVQDELGGLAAYVWRFVDGAPIIGKWRALSAIPAQTAESKAMSKDLKRRGFRFVGPTVCYAFMQAVGLVNDHTTSCFRYKELTGRSHGRRRAQSG